MRADRLALTFALTTMAMGLLACGDDGGPSPDACVAGAVTAQVTSPATYACMEPFRATISVTNGSCAPITVQDVMVQAQVTAGVCGAAGPGSFQPATASVPAGATVTVLDLTTQPFCCGAPGCPATLMCSETFTFTVDTSAGALTDSVSADLDLGGCSTVCP